MESKCLKLPAILLFDRHGHGDWLQGIVAVVPDCGDDLVHDIHPSKDLAEDGVGPVQPAVIRNTDIKLGSAVVEISRAVALPWHLGHGEGAPLMRSIACFGIQPVARTA